MPGEGNAQYTAFLVFMRLGEGRTCIEAYNRWRLLKRRGRGALRPGHRQTAPGYWSVWRQQYDWDNRAFAYDDSVRALELTTLEQCRRAWIQRQWALSQKAAKKAEQMLGAAVSFRRENMLMPDGETQVVYVPDGWTFNQAMDILERSLQLGKDALGMETKADVVVEHRVPNEIDASRKLLEEARAMKPKAESCIEDVKKLYGDGADK